jgi:hypothetical protein
MILFISWIIGIKAMIPAHPGILLEELFRSRKHPHGRKVSKGMRIRWPHPLNW